LVQQEALRLSEHKDPDFFAVIESTAAILAGLQAAVWLYRQLPFQRPRAPAARALREVADLIRYVEVDIEVINEVIAEAQIPGNRLYRPGRHAFLSKDQFDRYDKTVDHLFGRLRRVVKATHRRGRDLPTTTDEAVRDLERFLNHCKA
jgi:hypothetical protein